MTKRSDEDWAHAVARDWRLYVAPAVIGSASLAAFTGSYYILKMRADSAFRSYEYTGRALEQLKESVAHTAGDKALEKAQEYVAEKALKDAPEPSEKESEVPEGKDLVFDAMTGRYFHSDVETLRSVENNLNHTLINEMWVSLNTVYSELGLDEVRMGDILGWNSDHLVHFAFRSKLTQNNIPCIVLDYLVEPKADYYRSI